MRPDDQPLNKPSAPPPSELPRPRMMDVRPAQSSPAVPTRPADQRTPGSGSLPPVATEKPPISHPGDHLIEAPHEKLLEKGMLDDISTAEPKKKRSKTKLFLWGIAGLFILGVVVAVAAVLWYKTQLDPVSPGDTKSVRMTIEAGSSPSQIAELLENKGVIKSQFAFTIYTKLTKTQDSLKAGAFNLRPSESTPQIVDHLVAGKQDTFSLTFLPGDTLANNKKKLLAVGYSEAEVDAALAKTYDRPLFAGKPQSADLEGYIYGETYEFDTAASVESILNRTFDEYEKAIARNNLVEGYKKQNMTLYEGITLASIVQREVTGEKDEQQVARVFMNRIAAGMTLGSDVTYQYIADKTGVPRDTNLDSPYNTRRYKGLPPGPIASPGLGALKAVANPGVNDYLFFLSGDDDVTYFGRTDAEHQKNIVDHCKKKCSVL